MFRYRWMANYLAVPHMVDKFTMGLRDEALRIVHTAMDFVVYDVANTMDDVFRGDRPHRQRRGIFQQMRPHGRKRDDRVHDGLPEREGHPARGADHVRGKPPDAKLLHALPRRTAVRHRGRRSTMPEAEAGCSIDDDFAVLGVCAVQCNTTCDGSLMGNGLIAKRLEREYGIPTFQLVAPMRHQGGRRAGLRRAGHQKRHRLRRAHGPALGLVALF